VITISVQILDVVIIKDQTFIHVKSVQLRRKNNYETN